MSNIDLELVLSSLGSVYLEAEFLTSRFSLFCLPWVAIPGSGMSNIDLELILSSLGSMHIPGRFCYLCNKKEAKQNKRLTDCQVFIYN